MLTHFTLGDFRSSAGVTQAKMAESMGIPLRTYEDIESGRSNFRQIHFKAARMALIEIALEKSDGGVLTDDIKQIIKAAYELL